MLETELVREKNHLPLFTQKDYSKLRDFGVKCTEVKVHVTCITKGEYFKEVAAKHNRECNQLRHVYHVFHNQIF